MSNFIVLEVQNDRKGIAYAPRGAARQLWQSKAHEVMIAGPAETGKTWAACQKLDALLWRFHGSQAVMVRKTQTSLFTTVLQTYRKIAGESSGIVYYGGNKPEWADYPNGSRLFFGGMDNPGKALSSERDFIYVNQAEELNLDDWEVLTTRCTGRAGNSPYPQIMGDCNPGPPHHWIINRPSIVRFESRHEDNPTLFDDAGNITPQGVRSIGILDLLTGARKQRLRYGKWVQAEGAVYEGWDTALHLITQKDLADAGMPLWL